jgi:hypothetical protein
MRPAETFEDFEAVVLREQDESMGMALPFAFASVRDTGASTAGGDPICVTGDGAVIIKHHDDLYGWQAVARNLDRFEALEQLERDAASAGIQAGLGTVCHQARFKTPGGPPSEHAAAWNQASNRALVKYLVEPEQLADLDRLVARVRDLGNTVEPMLLGHSRVTMLRDYFLTDAEQDAGPGLAADVAVRWLDRAIWICEALCAGRTRGPRAAVDDDADAFIELFGDAVAAGDLDARRADALYWMWWCFFRGTDEMLDAILAPLRDAADPLIESSAALVAELAEGRDSVGAVSGIRELRAALRSG